MIIEENYREHPALSNSDLKLLKRPSEFYAIKYGDEEREDKEVFRLGDMLDLKCFDPDSIEEKYILREAESPSSAYHKSYVEHRLEGLDPIEAYSREYKTSNKSEEKIEKKAKELEERYKEYIQFVKDAEGKAEYTVEDEYAVSQMKMSIMGHQAAARLILADEGKDHEEFFSHLAIEFELGEIPFKGEIDRLIVDTKNKRIQVIDLKTTGRPIYSFGYQAKKYDYPRQLLIYGEGAAQFLKHRETIKEEEIDEWKFQYLLVAVEKNEPHECRVFEVPRVAMIEASEDLKEKLSQYEWHKENDVWDRMPSYYENDGIEPLDYRPDPNNMLQSMMGKMGGGIK